MRVTTHSMKAGVPAAVLAVLMGWGLGTSACSDASLVAPTSTSANQLVAVESFTGTLLKNGSRFYSFTVTQSGPVSIVLLALQENGAASTVTVGLGLGVPRATTCLSSNTVTVGVGVTPQLSLVGDPLVYCAVIFDVGNLTAPTADFAINITRPR